LAEAEVPSYKHPEGRK